MPRERSDLARLYPALGKTVEMKTTSFTLCVTAHKVEHLSECLKSVRSQGAHNFDLILCADTTGDSDLLEAYERFAANIPVKNIEIIAIRGGTAGITRNAAFRRATTEWVTYLDGDDVLDPRAMGELAECIATGVPDIINTGIFRLDSAGARQEMPASLTYKPPLWLYHVDPRTVGHWAFFNQLMAIRQELWQKYPFSEVDTNREDVDFMLHQLLNGHVVRIPKALYGYRRVCDGFSSKRYEHGDICQNRYDSGYYQRLFVEKYEPRLSSNFL